MTIFDHIRRKAKDFPLFSETQTPNEASVHHLSPKQLELGSDTRGIPKWKISDNVIRDTMIITDSETRDVGDYVGDSRSGKRVKVNASPRVSSVDVDLSSTNVLPFDVSMLKNDNGTDDKGISMESRRKQQNSPSVQQNQRCSMETPAKAKTAQSFLGFESVFSFL